MSKTVEKVGAFLDLTRKNLSMKLSSMEHNSLLPDLQSMLQTMYKNIPLFNYVTNSNLCPDLGTYNIHYPEETFAPLQQTLQKQEQDKTEVLEVKTKSKK